MTRKDFELIAKINADLISTYTPGHPVVISMAMRQCRAFKDVNTNFNAKKFLIASGFSLAEVIDIAAHLE